MIYSNLLYRQKSFAFFNELDKWQAAVDKANEWQAKGLAAQGTTAKPGTAMAFEAFLEGGDPRPRRRRRLTYAVSLAVHAALLAGGASFVPGTSRRPRRRKCRS